MPIIRLLDPSTAERIAAGEVIERPAAVVKELIENSIDAGASKIQVKLEEGGKKWIEVTDNGFGMGCDDLKLCIKRHATSKIQSLDDLEKLVSLGFRGEALASIAAVGDLCLYSREKGKTESFQLDAGALETRFLQQVEVRPSSFLNFLDSPHGTRITLASLFSQVPARLKFLRSTQSELKHIRDLIERLALAQPACSFSLWHQNREILSLPAQSEKQRAQFVLQGEQEAPQSKHPQLRSELAFLSSDEKRVLQRGLQLRVYWLEHSSSPSSQRIFQILNHRPIRDRLVQQSILSSFRQSLLPGRYPSLVLYIEMNPSTVDVNVHPTKAEVRFLDAQSLFQQIQLLLKTLIRIKSPLAPLLPESVEPPREFPKDFPRQEPKEMQHMATSKKSWFLAQDAPSFFRPSTSPVQELLTQEVDTQGVNTQAVEELSNFSSRYLASLFETYLLFQEHSQQVGTFLLLDQHAAHERIRYEALRRDLQTALRENHPMPSQKLLFPETISLLQDEKEVFQKNSALLLQLGFECEDFGASKVLLRASPAAWGRQKEELPVRFKNILQRMKQCPEHKFGSSVFWDEGLFESFASLACHSAVRSGETLGAIQAQALLLQLRQQAHPEHCPHGRPTIIRIPESQIEKWFLRRVGQKSALDPVGESFF